MHPLIKKLNYREQKIIAILGAPESFEPIVGEWRELATVDTHFKVDTVYSFMLCFVQTQEDIARFAKQVSIFLTEDDPILWFAYPKKSSKRYQTDISRDQGWQPLGDIGFEPVRQVAIDEDWSALRFRQVKNIKTMSRNKAMALSKEGKKRSR